MDKPLRKFDSAAVLEYKLADEIARGLAKAIAERGRASLAVAGGSTPRQLFSQLSCRDLPWSQISVTLTDERCVDTGSDDSNEHLVRKYLLTDKAADATFLSLNSGGNCSDEDLRTVAGQLQAAGIPPFDVLILGMGEDGHTASLFPCAAEIGDAMSVGRGQPAATPIMKVQPRTAPHSRVTFTLHSLLNSDRIFLHLVGDKKLAVLRQARAGTDELAMPIRAFLHRQEANTEVFWAPA